MALPILSIVSGTYNRLRYVQRMMFSARQSIPRGLPCEFVIVDGGSTDGTLEWLRQQPDVRLIEHGALLGAIRAFTDGGMAARGLYTLMANDDIEFVGDGILKALVHLETHPNCAAVAMADDRPAPGYGSGYKVQRIRALRNGQPVDVPYAQVGLFRTALLQEVGVWGADDAVMSKSRTYGGDNFLSARLWELGYTVDAVDGVFINDLLAPDALRDANVQDAESKPSPYYERYPAGVVLPSQRAAVDAGERLRVLYLPIYEPGSLTQQVNKRGLRDALAEHFLVYEFDYCNVPYIGEAPFADTLTSIVRTWQPHLMLMQAHGTDRVTPPVLAKVRAVRQDMVVVNWNGDVFSEHLTGERMLELLRHVDLQLTVNASVLPVYEQHGIAAAYWQVGYEPVPDALPVVPAHDVVFLANAYSPERVALGRTLKGLPYDVGLYGYGWNELTDGFTLYDFAVGAALYRNSKAAIGDNQYPGERGFVSNRVFEALANGAFLLHQHVEGLQELTGLEDGVHYIAWTDAKDLKRKLKYWLADERADERKQIAAAGEAYVREQHSFAARVRELFMELLPKVGERELA